MPKFLIKFLKFILIATFVTLIFIIDYAACTNIIPFSWVVVISNIFFYGCFLLFVSLNKRNKYIQFEIIPCIGIAFAYTDNTFSIILPFVIINIG